MKEIETKSRESAQKCLHLIYNAMSDAVINSIKDELQKYRFASVLINYFTTHSADPLQSSNIFTDFKSAT